MKFLHNLETSSKLLAGFAVVLGLTVLLGLSTLSRLHEITQLLHACLKDNSQPAALQADALYDNARLLTWSLLSLTCCGGALLARWLARAISAPLQQAMQVALRIAAGDLGSRIAIHGNNETARLLQAMQGMNDSLCGIVGQVRGAASLGGAADEIAAGLNEAIGVFSLEPEADSAPAPARPAQSAAPAAGAETATSRHSAASRAARPDARRAGPPLQLPASRAASRPASAPPAGQQAHPRKSARRTGSTNALDSEWEEF